MIKNITIICAGLFFASCSNFDLAVMGKKAGENFDKSSPEQVCMGSEKKAACLENMKLVKELEKENTQILAELKEQKREIQELKRDLSEQCIKQGGVVVGNDCVKD